MQPESPQPTKPGIAPEEQETPATPGEQPAPEENELLIEWTVKDDSSHKHNTTWFIFLGVVGLVIILGSAITETWFMLPLGALVPWAISIYANRGIGEHSYKLETFSFSIDGKSYPYSNYKSFFEVANGPITTFELVPNQRFGQLATIHVSGEDVEDVAEILASVLPESEPKGYVGESILRRLKF